MSRIGKKPVALPAKAKASVSGNTVTIEGPKGTLSFDHRPEVSVGVDGGAISVTVPEGMEGDRMTKAYWGTTRAIINNMVKGVTDGYEKKLEIVGVGWSANLSGNKLAMKIGYANIIEVMVPTGVNVSVEKQFITVNGPDKQAVGQFAAMVRSKKKPEPYNGKGIKYTDEVIKRKQGKAFGA